MTKTVVCLCRFYREFGDSNIQTGNGMSVFFHTVFNFLCAGNGAVI